tara:strand:+ start:2061 stop:2975 length:915 start_codon:yes stop_codon:yes gene_type:complete
MENLIDRLIKRFLLIRSKSGGYKFFFKKILNYKSDYLQNRLIQSEFFSKELKIIELNIEKYKNILVIAPHQDDEIIGPGGTLIKARNFGSNINILFFTDGDQKYANVSSDIIQIRKAESIDVCSKLCANTIDIEISNQTFDIKKSQIQLIKTNLEKISPDLILTPWFLDSPSHRFVNYIFANILKKVPSVKSDVWCYETHNQLFPNGIVNISSVIKEKIELLSLYESQINNGFSWDHIVIGKNAYNSKFFPKIHPPKLYTEIFTVLPIEKYIESSIVENRDLEHLYLGNISMVESSKKLESILK